MSAGRLLVVEDDQDMQALLEEELTAAGYTVAVASDAAGALDVLASEPFDTVVTDLVMPGLKGSDLLEHVRSTDPDLPVVIITAFGTIDSAVEAVKKGAYHYVAKPFPMELLLATVGNAVRERSLRAELARLRAAASGDAGAIVAASEAMRRTMQLIERAARADTPVLLVGESGTGKELLARALHLRGTRSGAPFLAVNCSAIPESLLESQLFGHRKGAFTDAREDRRGLFQEARGGTLLLDEIGDMPLPLQAKMLRVLQEKEVHPLGAAAPVPVNARVVAATNRNLEEDAASGRFRQDLFYRLNVITIRVPPLRERPEDLVPLAAHFLEKHGRATGRAACTLSPQALERLRSHDWPGNVRELENAIERALVLGHDDVIWPADLPDALRVPGALPAGKDLRRLSEVERDHILRTLRNVRGNKAAAARILGMDRKTLYRKLEAYGIRKH